MTSTVDGKPLAETATRPLIQTVERNVLDGTQDPRDLEDLKAYGHVTKPDDSCSSPGHRIDRCLECCPALPKRRNP
jgi:hypothetical protein